MITKGHLRQMGNGLLRQRLGEIHRQTPPPVILWQIGVEAPHPAGQIGFAIDKQGQVIWITTVPADPQGRSRARFDWPP